MIVLRFQRAVCLWSLLQAAAITTTSASTAYVAKTVDHLRQSLLEVLERNPEGHLLQDDTRHQFSDLLNEYAAHPECNPQDVLFTVGSSVFGVPKPSIAISAADENAMIIDFEYMQGFVKDVFISYGLPYKEAEKCARVLIESDRRGIREYGVEQMKSNYCNSIDQGMVCPTAPIDILKETPTTAVVDARGGLGLRVGPYCMQLAIDKAKKNGIGLVVVQRTNDYGLPGYYASMASDQGCISLTGGNSIKGRGPQYHGVAGMNPCCLGIPTDEEYPFIIDSSAANHGIATAATLLSASFQTEMLGLSDDDRRNGYHPSKLPPGQFFLAINIESICSLEVFQRNAGGILRAMRVERSGCHHPGSGWCGGIIVTDALRQEMQELRYQHPSLRDKYSKFPWEEGVSYSDE